MSDLRTRIADEECGDPWHESSGTPFECPTCGMDAYDGTHDDD